MTEDIENWEDVGRRLLYAELAYNVQERIEKTVHDIAEDIVRGEELTVRHLEQLVWMLEEILFLIRECVVPLVEDKDEWKSVFQLAKYPN